MTGLDKTLAWVWFFSAVGIGTCMAYGLSAFDRDFFDREGHVLDYDDYRENRAASTSIKSESVDPRTINAKTAS